VLLLLQLLLLIIQVKAEQKKEADLAAEIRKVSAEAEAEKVAENKKGHPNRPNLF
jgi:hypothetical protein